MFDKFQGNRDWASSIWRILRDVRICIERVIFQFLISRRKYVMQGVLWCSHPFQEQGMALKSSGRLSPTKDRRLSGPLTIQIESSSPRRHVPSPDKCMQRRQTESLVAQPENPGP